MTSISTRPSRPPKGSGPENGGYSRRWPVWKSTSLTWNEAPTILSSDSCCADCSRASARIAKHRRRRQHAELGARGNPFGQRRGRISERRPGTAPQGRTMTDIYPKSRDYNSKEANHEEGIVCNYAPKSERER